MIRIRGKRHNFRRCGIAHPKDPVDYPNDRFTEKEIEILKAESMLIVELIPDEPARESRERSETEQDVFPKSEPEVEEEAKIDIEEKAEEEAEEEAEEIEIGEPPIVLAARQAIEAGKVTRDGRPLVEAIEEILGRDINAAERDRAFEQLTSDK